MGFGKIKSSNSGLMYKSESHEKVSFEDKTQSHFDNVLKEIFSSKRDVPVRNEFRISSMPLCSILYSLKSNLNTEETRFQDHFYFSLGHNIHEAVQMFASQTKDSKAWGNWKCYNCKTTYQHGFKPKECVGCSSKDDMYYEEITLKYKSLTGHVDMINYSEYGWSVFDYKTCSIDYITNIEKTVKLPHPKNVHQIETYCVLLWLIHKIWPSYYVLSYISRDQNQGSFVDQTWNVNWLFKNCVVKWTKEKYFKRLNFINRALLSHNHYLNWIKTGSKYSLESMLDHRPCQSQKDYVSYGYDTVYSGHCKFWNGNKCVVTSKSLTKLIERKSDDS